MLLPKQIQKKARKANLEEKNGILSVLWLRRFLRQVLQLKEV